MRFLIVLCRQIAVFWSIFIILLIVALISFLHHDNTESRARLGGEQPWQMWVKNSKYSIISPYGSGLAYGDKREMFPMLSNTLLCTAASIWYKKTKRSWGLAQIFALAMDSVTQNMDFLLKCVCVLLYRNKVSFDS